MILRWLGRLFRVVARLRHGEVAQDLEHVGRELERLDPPAAHAAPTSR